MIKINLPATHEVTKGTRDGDWTARVVVTIADLTPEIVARLAIHGLHQKVADAASGAKTEAEAQAAMEKAADAILAGEWSSRASGGGVDEWTTVARMIVRQAFKAKVGAKSAEWADFTGLDAAEQNERLDAIYAKNEAAFAKAIETKMEARRIERAAKAGITADFDI